MLAALCQAVFRPAAFCQSAAGQTLIGKHGWLFIAVRWLHYSLAFTLFRDYHGVWKPFAAPPFGLSLDTYAVMQKSLSLVFGFALMAAIAEGLAAYFKIIGRGISLFRILNILGVTFFLPFVPLQLYDAAAMTFAGWAMMAIIPAHTMVLLWEAVATMLILDHLLKMRLLDRVIGVVLVMGVWIGLATLLWR